MNDSELLEHVTKAVNGEQQSLTALFEEYKDAVYCFLTNYIDNERDIEDVVQEAFISAFNSLHTLENRVKFKNWIFTIAYRRAMDFHRANKPSKAVNIAEDETSIDDMEEDKSEFIPSEMLETEETRDYIAGLVRKLPEAQKTAVLFYYYRQMSIPDIAEALECSEGTIKSRLNYARKSIKADIDSKTKKGYKVIVVVPLPLLTQILLRQAEGARLSQAASAGIWNGIESSLNVTPQAAISANTAATASSGAKLAVAAVPAKLIAGIVGIAAVVVTAAVFVVSQPKENDETEPVLSVAQENIQTGGLEVEEPIAPSDDFTNNTDDTGIIELKSKSDYARMYYDMVQRVYINDEGFIDAEMAQCEDGSYTLELLYDEGGYKCYYVTVNADTYDYSAEPEKVLYEFVNTGIETAVRLGAAVAESAMIVDDGYGREALLTVLQGRAVTGNYTVTYASLDWRRKDSFTFSASYDNEALDENGMFLDSTTPDVFRLLNYKGGTQEYADEIILEEIKSKRVSTWGFGHGETDFTKGERLKAYFE